MSDDDSSVSDFEPRPSGSKCSTRRSTRAVTAATAAASSAGGGAESKRKRRIVMRIEFDDSDDDEDEDESTASDYSTEESVDDDLDARPSCSTQPQRRLRGRPKKQQTETSVSASQSTQQQQRRSRLRPQKQQTAASAAAVIEDQEGDDLAEEFERYAVRRLRNLNKANIQGLNSSSSSSDGSSSGSEINNRRVKTRGKLSKNHIVVSEDEQPVEKKQEAEQPDEAGFNSDSSSNELLEKCPICLLTFRQQEIGSPATCEHIFCAACIDAWSRNVQTCPIDRIEFDRIIVRETYENRKIVREIKIDPNKSHKELMLNDDDDAADVIVVEDDDLTYCEICENSDREDVMILCDSCNQGYHIDCLTPALDHIPEGSWYCDNCFDSEDEGSDEAVEEDLNMLYEDIRDMGIPGARVTEVLHQPRILRTRQNERIRAAILRHTRANTTATATTTITSTSTSSSTTHRGRGRPRIARAGAEESATAISSRTTTTTRTRTRTTTAAGASKPRKRRRRRRRARQRTYVVEYDLNNFDQKFAIKTTKKIVRRRKRKTRKIPKTAKRRDTTNTRSIRKHLAEQLGIKKPAGGCNSNLPGSSGTIGGSLSLFGNTNDLEYFSADDDDGALNTEIQIDTGRHGATAVQTSVRISSFGGAAQRSRKGLLLGCLQRNSGTVRPTIPTMPTSNTPDLLSSLMDLQDRWHNVSRNMESVRIDTNGTLSLPPASERERRDLDGNARSDSITAPTETSNNPPESRNSTAISTQNPSSSDVVVTEAPMYPQGGGGNSNFNRGGGAGGGGGGYNNHYNNQNNYRGDIGNQYRHSTGGGGGMNAAGGTGGGGGGNFNSMGGHENFNNNNPNFNANPNPNFSPFNLRFNPRNQPNNNNQQQQQQQRNDNQRHSLPFNNINNNRNDNMTQPPPQQLNSSFSQPGASTVPHPPHPPPTPQFDNSLFSGLPPPIAPQLQSTESQLFSGPGAAPTQALPPTLQSATVGPSLMSIPPPPAPPPGVQMPWTSSLFQLTSDYGNADDDDSNCPNFSVYSAESQEVAKSTEINKTGNAGEAPKEDDENEDLVQLDDDDEIPMPPEESSDTAVENSTADLYEPENPTEENDVEAEQDDDNDDNDDENIKKSVSGGGNAGTQSKSNDNEAQYDPEQETISQMNSIDDAEESNNVVDVADDKLNENNEDADTNDDDDDNDSVSNNARVEREQIENPEESCSRSPSPAVSGIKLPESEASAANRKGVLELYDDSDWEELNIDKPKGLDKNDDDKKEKDKSPTADTNDDDDDEVAPEQDRSYTPCLDENNDPEEPAEGAGGRTPELTSPVAPGNTTAPVGESDKSTHSVEENAAGIAGMETELISDDDDNSRGRNKRRNKRRDRDRGRDGDKDNDGTFKKVSNKQKERNYRNEKPTTTNRRNDRRRGSSRSKSRSRSRTRTPRGRGRKRSRSFRSRSRSNNKENQGWRQGRFGAGGMGRGGGRRFQQQRNQRPKRRELPRYDVRNVVGTQQRHDRYAKDRYGRDTSRQPRSRSGSRGHGRPRSSFSRTRSRSLSAPPQNKRNRRCSFSMSPSPSAAAPTAVFNRQSHSPPPPKHRFISPQRRSRSHGEVGGGRRPSPVHHHRQRSRSPLHMKSRSLSPAHRMNGRKVTRMMRDGSPLEHVPRVSRSRDPSLLVSPRYTPRMSRSRSKSPNKRQKGKKRKLRDKRKKKMKKRAVIGGSISPEINRRISRQRGLFELEKPPKKKRRHSPKSKRPVDEPGTWSPSPSPPRMHEYPPPSRDNNISWTPPIISPRRGGVGIGDESADMYEPETRRSVSKESKKDKRNKRNNGGKPKKKKSDKRRETRKDKRRQRRTETPEPAPSKEVFASGNNILVSVSFNKEVATSSGANLTQQQQQQTTVVTLPPNREDLLANNRRVSVDRQTNAIGNKKNKKENKTHKRKKIDTKPVAIIDLERSPFQVHQEPTDIIVLTDSEDATDTHDTHHDSHRRGGSRRRSESRGRVTEDDDNHQQQLQQQQRNQMGGGGNSVTGRASSSSQHDKTPPMERLDTILEESYDIPQTGPKTPPEPPAVKFNIPTKKQNKVRNPLHEEAEINSETELQEREEHEQQQHQQHRQDMDAIHNNGGGSGIQSSQKIGPNTPPESGPCSPDAYDPFEPTKSPSMSPRSPTPPPLDASQISTVDSADGVSTLTQKHISDERERVSGERESSRIQQIPGVGGNVVGNSQTTPLNPVELVMALMNSKANSSQDLANKSIESQFSNTSSHMLSSGINSSHDDSLRDKSSEESGNGVTVLSNLIISTGSQQQSQHIPSISSPTPTPILKNAQIMKLPMPKVVGGSVCSSSGMGMPSTSSNMRNGGGGVGDDSFNINDIESPYSPGSADYEDLFEPPPDTSSARKRHKRGGGGVGGKVDMFDLFGSSSPVGQLRLPSYTPSTKKNKNAGAAPNRKARKGRTNTTIDDNKMYDDVPNSAVDLQVKDKFLRKLNRQERVVEEVKLILKPRFNKKQITKDDYKEIMRRAVPKICHSRTGEINPHKIKNLIEAYVKKFRAKHKKLNIINTGQVSSAVKCAAYLKKL